MNPLWHDLAYAARSLARQRGFCAIVVLTLGLGIGANAAIFSAVHALLFRASPFRDPERLVRIASVRGGEEGPVSEPEFDDLKALPIIEDAALYTDQGMYNASGFGAPEELQATIATASLFRVLGVNPVVGAPWPDHYDRTRQFALVISHDLWTRRFGRDPAIVGRTMTLDGSPGYSIHGVLPPGFNFPSHSDLFRSNGISADPRSYERRDLRSRYVVARLRPGVSVEQAQAMIDALGARLEREFPATNARLGFRITPLRELYSGAVRPYALLLMGAAGLLLLITCVNAASLLLSRTLAREREIAIRVALGAGRGRVVRQVLAESLLLSVAGGAAGWAVAFGGVRLLAGAIPIPLPPWMQFELDGGVALFLAAACLATGLTASLLPALQATRVDGQAALKESSRGSSGGVRSRRMRHALIVAEVALATVLLVGAGLLLQSVRRMQRTDLGFAPKRLLTFRVELGWAAYGTREKTHEFHRQALEALRVLPGVRGVTLDHNLPMSGKPRDPDTILVEGQDAEAAARNPYVNFHVVGPDYFSTLGIRLERGRDFGPDDRADSPMVMIVSRSLADRLWPGADPIGRRLKFAGAGSGEAWATVIGVAGPVLHHELDGAAGFDLYQSFTQASSGGAYYAIRTEGEPAGVLKPATAIIGTIDPDQSFFDVQPMDRRIENRIWQRRLAAGLFGAFAGTAFILAAVGLYGGLSYLVAQQTREIGVRLALGAAPADITRMVVRRGLGLAGAGAAIGLPLALVSARFLSGFLYEVSPIDPFTLVIVGTALLAIAGLASLQPARRAMRVDPIHALRAE